MTTLPAPLTKADAFDPALAEPHVRPFDRAKTVVDFLLALVLLVPTLPMMLACAAIIRWASPGPALLRQQRLGRHGQVFTLYKLRTMRADAEARTGPVLAAFDDDRVIPACRWMRLTHMDELPQLFNILLGQMALVGPRPERPEIARQIYRALPSFRQRLAVKPGITGLAQVRNGYDKALDRAQHKLNYDMEYIRRRGWRLDLRILAMTLTKVVDTSAH